MSADTYYIGVSGYPNNYYDPLDPDGYGGYGGYGGSIGDYIYGRQ